ncbi:MAG: sulfatase [Balneolaceae bacterium]|nr:sulfatase [Balneolaceae bacterium]
MVLISSCRAAPPEQPNILIAIADDATYTDFGAYGSEWVRTPAFDRVAEQGLLFMNAYTPNSKCAPSRSSILTGRNSWQLEEAANHVPYFPEKFRTYPEVLTDHGYHVGFTGKGWAPGDPGTVDGNPRRLAGTGYNKITTEPPAAHISAIDYAANFERFLEDREEGQPFAFWYGGLEPHRAYRYGAGVELGGKSIETIESVPAFLPDTDTVRTDLLDYAFEIEYFDRHLGVMLEILERRGELDNTLVLVTSDNGMPFPRAKGQAYEFSNHMPMAVMWSGRILQAGRKIEDFVSFIDIAPTFLQAAGIEPARSGMQPITGESLVGLFNSADALSTTRDRVLIGKERHDIGRPHDRGYPVRGIVTDEYLYLVNFKPDRWPAGNPETGYLNTDGSPTKTWILDHRDDPADHRYWRWSFGKRPEEELYNRREDPGCIENLLGDGGTPADQEIGRKLRNRLFDELRQQGDPRVLGNGEVFDNYPYANEQHRNFYRRYMSGELGASDAGWVNPSDFDTRSAGAD